MASAYQVITNKLQSKDETGPECSHKLQPCDTSPSGQVFVVGEDLFAELVDELVEAEVDLGLDLVVEELLPEAGERVVAGVVVQVQWVQHAPNDGRDGGQNVYNGVMT